MGKRKTMSKDVVSCSDTETIKEKKDYKTHTIIIHVPAMRIIFCVGGDSYIKYIKDNYDTDVNFDCMGITTRISSNNVMGEVVIGIDGDISGRRRDSVIAHEISHAANNIMEATGIKDDEYRSYLIEYLTYDILDYIDSLDKKE